MRRRLAALAVLAVAGLAVAGSARAAVPFDLAAFFAGSSQSAGEVRTLLVFRETFTAVFTGGREGERLRLDERFAFEDGARLQRWDLTQRGAEIFGTVETELGDGTLAAPVPVAGTRTPDGAVLTYRGHAPGGGATLFGFRHEMTANADGTVSNHVSVTKFGLVVATSDVTFAKSAAALAAHLPRP